MLKIYGGLLKKNSLKKKQNIFHYCTFIPTFFVLL